MEATRKPFLVPWITLAGGLVAGAGIFAWLVAGASISNPFRLDVSVNSDGNLPEGEKHIVLSVTGHHYSKSVRWKSPDHTKLEITNVYPDPAKPEAPKLDIACKANDNICDLKVTAAYSGYSYTPCVTTYVNGQPQPPKCGTDPWIHVNP